jgi:predicted trehalose synthase
MSVIDWSNNGTLADEAIWLGSVLTFLGTLVTVVIRQGKIGQTVTRIDSTLNHVGEPAPAEGPTLGQRVARIEERTDRMDTKLDKIANGLQDLSLRMIEHISDEARRTTFLESKVQQLDRRKWEAPRDDQEPAD